MHTEKWERNSANADLKYLPCEISRLPAMISEGSRDRGKTPLVLNEVVDIGLCKCRSYNWRIHNEVVKATQNHCEMRGSILFYYCNYLPLCIMTRRSSYRKLWSILKNVEMNHNKRALTRNRCQWSVNISWPGKGRYIYTCTTLIGNNFYCVLKSSTLNQNKARFKVWIKQKLALYRTNLIWMTFLHQCKHLFSMLSCSGSVTEIHCWRLCKIF